MLTDVSALQLPGLTFRTSESLQYLINEMIESDMDFYLRCDWERADWNVCRILSLINTAGKEAWNCYPFD